MLWGHAFIQFPCYNVKKRLEKSAWPTWPYQKWLSQRDCFLSENLPSVAYFHLKWHNVTQFIKLSKPQILLLISLSWNSTLPRPTSRGESIWLRYWMLEMRRLKNEVQGLSSTLIYVFPHSVMTSLSRLNGKCSQRNKTLFNLVLQHMNSSLQSCDDISSYWIVLIHAE